MLPSATEIVCALGLRDQLVGVSHSCNYPQDVRDLPLMTSTRVPLQADSHTIDTFVRDHLAGNDALYDLDLDALRAAAPDVIVSQTLCDVCAVSTGDVFAALQSLPSRPALVDLTPNTLQDVLDDIGRVGEAVDAGHSGLRLVADLRARLDAVAERTARIRDDARPRIGFLEWLLPPFNGGHWNPELVTRAGGVDLFGAQGRPSSTMSWGDVADADPDVLFIACCGFRIDRATDDLLEIAKRPDWQALSAVRQGRVYVADGNAYFASPGPRLVDSLEILAHALHPDVHPNLHPDSAAISFV